VARAGASRGLMSAADSGASRALSVGATAS